MKKGGAVRRSSVNPTNLFSVDSYDLKSMSFKFGNDIFITLDNDILENHISLLFRPSVIRGPSIS